MTWQREGGKKTALFLERILVFRYLNRNHLVFPQGNDLRNWQVNLSMTKNGCPEFLKMLESFDIDQKNNRAYIITGN